MRGRRWLAAAVTGTAVLQLAAPRAWAQGAPRPPAAGSANRLELVAMDFAFRVPATVRPGLAEITLRNTGKKLHHVQLFRLADGKRLGDLYPELVKRRGVASPPSWATPAGGPSAALPGSTILVRQALEPGRYAVICWIPAPDGQPHFMKGMAGEFEVTGQRVSAAPPTGTVRATVREYAVELSRPLVRGRQVVEVHNTGKQPHEFLLVRLDGKRTVEEVAKWSEQGQPTFPSPAASWSGVAALAPGERAWLDLDLPAGRYAIFCLSPDTGDGRPHLLHGLVREFELK